MMNIALTQQLRRFKIIERPHLSEKSTMLADKHRQFVFKVLKNANKSEIKQAVESLFNVKVKGWKKAYVSLKAGYDIDFTGTK